MGTNTPKTLLSQLICLCVKRCVVVLGVIVCYKLTVTLFFPREAHGMETFESDLLPNEKLFSLTHLSNSQLKKREESLSLPSFHGCLLIPPNCAALRTVRMCCKTSLTARLMLRPHGLMVGKQGSDSSYPGTPATSYYNDPQSPPSAR